MSDGNAPEDAAAALAVGWDFTLATDLDGTFLGGTAAARRALYDWIETRRGEVGLIFVTGRDPAFITGEVRAGRLPRPDFVVGDVGTTIAEVSPSATLEPIPALEAEIARLWDDSGARVREALDGVAGLTLQPTPFRYRVSYDMDPRALDPSAEEIVRALGFDALKSNNQYFDVLPRGISKGPSLLRLVEHLGLSRASVLAAGDTMNDFSMLTCGLPAVAVGGSETALLEALADAPAYRAQAVGAAGISEAIAALSLHSDPPEVPHAL